ncbi:MAG TPA: 16S rRNA (uracil(1498)-N(3))-methyltransferase [Gammaproteobacteria bacterium]|nr:16S rRNA (uracil(1498)-N(3))-methyltransferase [Gammaproteobacteria bacterium]
MKLPRLFQNRPLQISDHIELDPNACHRLTAVLRAETDRKVILFNGDGFEYLSIITLIKRNRVSVTILGKTRKNLESVLEIHLGQVISKGEKMDFVVQKATELGVKKITPLFSERSVVHLKQDRLEKKTEHWQKIAIHAAEQCGRTVVPAIEHPIPIAEWVLNRDEKTRLGLDPLSLGGLNTLPILGSVALLIGPEGGLTEQELIYAKERGFQTVSCGPRILRTETAALVAITALQCKAGDL